jgi:hypothetical protein
LTPSLYLIHNLIDNYLGLEKSKKMKDAALLNS